MGIEGLLQAHIVAPWAAVGTLPRTGEPKYISQYENAYKFSKLCVLLYRSCFVIVTVLQYFKWLFLCFTQWLTSPERLNWLNLMTQLIYIVLKNSF